MPVLRAARRVALAGHVTPDADCIGALGSLWLALPELGIAAYLALPPESVARRLSFLVQRGGLVAADAAALAQCDLVLALDTAKEPRLNVPGGLGTIRGIAILNVDHHDSNTQFGKWNLVESRSSSCSELVYELLAALGCRITPTIATLLFAGMHSDTQGFSLSNTGPRTLEIAAALAAAGAAVAEVGDALQRSVSPSEFALLKVIYANTHVSDDGRLAWSTASYEEIAGAGCRAADIDTQVEVPRSVEGIRLALLLTEGERGQVRINFRGERGLSALGLARQFGGGGHQASAGAIISGSLAEVTPRVVEAARRYVAQVVTEESAACH